MASTIDSGVLNSVNGGPGKAGPAGADLRTSQDLSNNFMTMLVAQLQNQDPLEPTDNSEMVSQLAQINTLDGIENLNGTLQGIGSQIDAGQALEATGLIGEGVLVSGDRVLVGSNDEGDVSTTPFGIELDDPADEVTISISDGGGQVVRTYEIGAVEAGVSSFQWDGETGEGEAAADGAYHVTVDATQNGNEVSSNALNYAVVNGVTPAGDNGGFSLDLGGVHGQVAISDIKQIL